ncbi:hypothetical protein NDU88_006215, partial [Pleurodeles waltl]
EEQEPLPTWKKVQKWILRLEEKYRNASNKIAVGSCLVQEMSHVELLDAGCLHRWIPP